MKKEQIRDPQAEYLQEVISKFNSNNRAVKKNAEGLDIACLYAGGCAIGYKLIEMGMEELCKELDKTQNYVGVIFDRLPNELKEYGRDFLCDLQGLHDAPDNWDENGLSERGRHVVNRMIIDHELNMPKV